ncbi:MAG TPA: histidine phosphatase family protein [Sphingomicrobium sp.]|nr:histidine phosphatase family protein [Sphingomicrobium sp.]
MKRLGLLRHAKSSWDEPGLADFDRPLNRRGEKAAARMGEELRRRRVAFDAVLASPARRVTETLTRFEQGYGPLPEPRFDRAIYAAESLSLLEAVRRTDDGAASLLLVGHNPGLEDFAALLAAEDDPLFGRIAGNLPTAAFVALDVPAGRWTEVEPGTARIALYLKPRELNGC